MFITVARPRATLRPGRRLHVACNLGRLIRSFLLRLLLPTFDIAIPFADAETIIQQLSRSMLANCLLLSLPESPKWIDPSSVAIALVGFGSPLGRFFHLQNKMPFLQTSLGVLVLILCLVMVHEWLHWSLTKLSCPVWQRLHSTFKSQPIRLESSPGWPRFVRTPALHYNENSDRDPAHASHAFFHLDSGNGHVQFFC